MIYEDFKVLIERDFPLLPETDFDRSSLAPSSFSLSLFQKKISRRCLLYSAVHRERQQHEYELLDLTRTYVANKSYDAILSQFLQHRSTHPLILISEDGGGKTSLLAHFCQVIRKTGKFTPHVRSVNPKR